MKLYDRAEHTGQRGYLLTFAAIFKEAALAFTKARCHRVYYCGNFKKDQWTNMELSYMLNQMCHDVFSNADINAIRKARGFTKKETDSRSQFEGFYLSSIGVEDAMSALTAKEIACLHLLNRKSKEVDLTFFERIYGSADRGERYYYGTFTQRYKDTFKDVKQNLLRRGLLVMAEQRGRTDNAKMQRWRFRFPPEFAPYLPPLIPEPRHFDTPGDDRSAAVQREKVLEALGLPNAKPFWQKGFKCVASRGNLTLGKQPFSIKRLAEWQQSAWASVLNITMPNDGGQSLPPVETVQIILGTLAPGEWASLEQLTIFSVLGSRHQLPRKSVNGVGSKVG